MPSAAALRIEIERALDRRFPAALTPVPRTISETATTGVPEVDALLEGGLGCRLGRSISLQVQKYFEEQPPERKRLVFPPSTWVRRIATMETWKRARCVCGDQSQKSDGLWS